MIDVKIIKKPRDGQATSSGSWGSGVKEAAHAARADVADLAMEARHAKESDHAVSSDEAPTPSRQTMRRRRTTRRSGHAMSSATIWTSPCARGTVSLLSL